MNCIKCKEPDVDHGTRYRFTDEALDMDISNDIQFCYPCGPLIGEKIDKLKELHLDIYKQLIQKFIEE